MTQPVKPIRAWAEYDEHSLFIEPQPDEYPARYQYWYWPKTGKGQVWTEPERWRYSIVDVISDDESAPLRALRVLFDNGYELHLQHSRIVTTQYLWSVHNTEQAMVAHGSFTEDKDHEAVKRAMIAAAAVFNPTVSGE